MSSNRNSLSLQQPQFLFVLDIDENLISARLSPDDDHHLSDEALNDLGTESGDTLCEPLVTNNPTRIFVTVFRKKEWKDFFEKVAAINKQYQENFSSNLPLISLIFVTNGQYCEERFINNIFSKFFSQELTDTLFPDHRSNTNKYFFNIHSQKEHISSHLKKNEILDSTFTQQLLENIPSDLARLYGDNQAALLKCLFQRKLKGIFLDLKFEDLQKNFGVAKRTRVILVDDNTDNLDAVTEKGFLCIHHTSSDQDCSYEDTKHLVFKSLNGFLEMASKIAARQHLKANTAVTANQSPCKKRKKYYFNSFYTDPAETSDSEYELIHSKSVEHCQSPTF